MNSIVTTWFKFQQYIKGISKKSPNSSLSRATYFSLFHQYYLFSVFFQSYLMYNKWCCNFICSNEALICTVSCTFAFYTERTPECFCYHITKYKEPDYYFNIYRTVPNMDIRYNQSSTCRYLCCFQFLLLHRCNEEPCR